MPFLNVRRRLLSRKGRLYCWDVLYGGFLLTGLRHGFFLAAKSRSRNVFFWQILFPYRRLLKLLLVPPFERIDLSFSCRQTKRVSVGYRIAFLP